ncbi:amidohydrolase family protein [uncultured Enorma sp.]|uniref:amidohydrolase family protein n=1 Tax=uncultured Enorma sp. TaxID=1714346 RepID=UPI002804DE05|nr:amidohydrolase family protein [uncultured Enorma sp.]
MLIANGTVHDGKGNACLANVRITNGTIAEVAPELAAREGEEVFDATGMEVMPGFVQALGHWGVNGSMTEIRPSSQDNDELSEPITPELEAFYAFNGRAASIQQLGAWGLTAQGVAPTDNNLFGGTISVVGLSGVNPYDLLIKRNVAMAASVMGTMRDAYGKRGVAPQTRMWIFTHFDEQLRQAAAYEPKPEEKPNDKLAALKPVVEGEMPLVVSCDGPVAVAHVRDILEKYPKVKLVIANGSGLSGNEDWMLERDVALIVRVPSSPLEEAGSPATFSWKPIAKLMDMGVTVALSGEYSNSLGAREDLIWNAAELMKVLHDEERVLTAITAAPAKILGVEDVIGTIEPGKRADICVWSANPLKTYDAHAVRTFQAGEVVYAEGDEKTCM